MARNFENSISIPEYLHLVARSLATGIELVAGSRGAMEPALEVLIECHRNIALGWKEFAELWTLPVAGTGTLNSLDELTVSALRSANDDEAGSGYEHFEEARQGKPEAAKSLLNADNMIRTSLARSKAEPEVEQHSAKSAKADGTIVNLRYLWLRLAERLSDLGSWQEAAFWLRASIELPGQLGTSSTKSLKRLLEQCRDSVRSDIVSVGEDSRHEVYCSAQALLAREVSIQDLAYSIRLVALSAAPPTRSQLERCLENASGLVASGQSLESTLREAIDLNIDLPSPYIPLSIISDVIGSCLEPKSRLWKETLSRVEKSCPFWGLPWILAARAEYESGEPKRAWEFVLRGEPLVPVQDGDLFVVLDRLRTDERLSAAIRFEAARLLLRHKKTLRNYAVVLEMSRKPEISTASELVSLTSRLLDEVRRIHGDDPSNWAVEDAYDELGSAGVLCMQFARQGAAEGVKDRTWFRRWNEHALSFFERASGVWHGANDTEEPPVYVLIRECDALASILRYGRSDDPGLEDLRRLAYERVRELGMRFPHQQRTAQRMLTGLRMGDAHRARSASSPDLAKFVSDADTSFDAWWQLEFAPGREAVASKHLEFLFDFESWDRARAVADRVGDELAVLLAEARSGRVEEAAEGLSRLIDSAMWSQRTGRAFFTSARMLFRVVQSAPSESLSEGLRSRIAEQFLRMVPLVVGATKSALDDGDLARARSLLEVASEGAGDGHAAIADLRLRLALREVKDGMRPATTLCEEANSCLRAMKPDEVDARLSGAFLAAIRFMEPPPPLDPEAVWSLARRGNRVVDMDNALRWELATRPDSEWANRFIEAIGTYPEDRRLADIPSVLWSARPAQSADLLGSLVQRGVSSPVDANWLVPVLERMPGDFFFALDAVRTSAPSVSELSVQPTTASVGRRVLVAICSGFVRGLVERIDSEDEIRSRVQAVADWILSLASDLRPQACSQLFGAERGHLLSRALVPLMIDLQEAERDLASSDSLCGAVRAILSSLILAPSEASISVSSQENDRWGSTEQKAVLSECIRGAEGYGPMRRDEQYWRRLFLAVDQWQSSTGQDLDQFRTQLFETWIRIQRTLARHLVESAKKDWLLPIHTLKNHLPIADSEPIGGKRLTTIIETIAASRRFLALRSGRPHLQLHGVRELIEDVAYWPPIVSTRRKGSPPVPRYYVHIPSDEMSIFCDRSLLVEAVRSCLDNAQRACERSDSGQWVRIAVSRVTHRVRLEIEDDGCGADPDVVRRLNDDKNEDPISGWVGTGFGLRAARHVVREHGGSLEFSSRGRGRGSLVTMELPIVADQASSE